MPKLGIFIVDDHEIVREGLRAVLQNSPLVEFVGDAATGEDACARAEVLHPDVIIMDVSMPGMNGAEATRRILQVSPSSRVIALTAHEEPAYVRELLSAGARGYVLKRAVVQNLVRAIEVVTNGGVFLDPALARRPLADRAVEATDDIYTRGATAELSSREMEVASLAALGNSNKEIAATLEISVKTVETHKTRLMAKLGLSSRAQLVRYAIYRGWLTG